MFSPTAFYFALLEAIKAIKGTVSVEESFLSFENKA